jgi:hypothetical protein
LNVQQERESNVETSLQVRDALSTALPDLLALPDPEAAQALDVRLAILDQVKAVYERTYSERVVIIREVKRRQLWKHLVDPDTGQTFPNLTAWMSCSSFLGCRRTNFYAKEDGELLADIPSDKLIGIKPKNLNTLIGMSTAIRNEPDVLEAAKTLSPNEFTAKIDIEYPDQHIPAKKHLRLNPDRDELDAITRWVSHCKDHGTAVTTEEAIAMACTMALHDSELDEELAAMPQEQTA